MPVPENLGKDVWIPKRKMLDFWNSGSGRFATWLQQACDMKSWGLRCLSWISGSGGVPTWFGTLCRYVEFPGAQHECYTQTSPASVMNFLGCNIQMNLETPPGKKNKILVATPKPSKSISWFFSWYLTLPNESNNWRQKNDFIFFLCATCKSI